MNWINRLAQGRRLWLLLLLEAAVLGAENLLTFPLSVPYMRAATGQVYLDFCAFCSGAEIREQLAAFGSRGRMLQWWLLPTVDVLIPVLSCLAGMAALRRFAHGHAWLQGLPLMTMLLDFAENAAIAALLWRYPEAPPGLATLLGLLTGLKFVGYAATGLCALGAAAFMKPAAGARQPPRT